MPSEGSGFDTRRQALVIGPTATIAAGMAPTKWLVLRTAGLPRVKFTATRKANALTAASMQFFGQIGPDQWQEIAAPVAIPAAAVGTVSTMEITGNGYAMVAVFMADTSAPAAGDTTYTSALMATWA